MRLKTFFHTHLFSSLAKRYRFNLVNNVRVLQNPLIKHNPDISTSILVHASSYTRLPELTPLVSPFVSHLCKKKNREYTNPYIRENNGSKIFLFFRGDIMFNLMAVVPDRRIKWKNKLSLLKDNWSLMKESISQVNCAHTVQFILNKIIAWEGGLLSPRPFLCSHP